MLTLTKRADGVFLCKAGTENETVWTLTDYSTSPCLPGVCDCECHYSTFQPKDCECVYPLQCTVCGEGIYGQHFMCMDNGADNTHEECTMVRDTSYSAGAYL